MTLYAKWIPNNCTVTLNTVGGEVSSNMATVTFDSDYALEVPTRIGYTFVGWYDGTGNSAVAYTDANGKSLGKWNLTDGKTLYAKWQENTRLVPSNVEMSYYCKVDRINKKVNYNKNCIV